MQKHNFKWEDRPFDVLIKKYPNCKSSLRWWCNQWEKRKNGGACSYSIEYNKYLKEFMVQNPPNFAISPKCCYYAKKAVAKNYMSKNNINLDIIGVRKAEGGVRATAYKNCFSDNTTKDKADQYRPIFYYDNQSKKYYEDTFDICHSKCYTEYGLARTGCAGCPYNKKFENELAIIEKYEPKLYKAVNAIFGESYEYTRQYYKFRQEMKLKNSK